MSEFFQSGLGAITASTNYAIYSYNTTNLYGSTNTKIRKWANAAIAIDAAGILTVANSATNGFSVTANTKVRISISYTDVANAAMEMGITKNGVQLTTIIQNVTPSYVLARTYTFAADSPGGCSVTDIAFTNDVYRPQTDGTAAAAGAFAESGIYIVAEQIA